MIQALELGTVKLPGSHPRAHEKTCQIRAFAIRHGDGIVLFDTGVGSDSDVINELYEPAAVPLLTALHDAHIDERDITAIVNSHLHFDHCGQNGVLPRVPVWVQAAELAAAAVAGYTVSEWARLEPDRRRVIDGDEEIAPGLTILATPGHTPGHQSLLIESGNRRELIVGQACFCCADFRSNTVEPGELHDESFALPYAESLDRLRSLDLTAAHFSHDATVLTDAAS